MTDTNQKLREALQAISHIDDTTNHSVDASAALDRIGQIARQALTLPPAVPESLEALSRKLDTHTPDRELLASIGVLDAPPVFRAVIDREEREL